MTPEPTVNERFEMWLKVLKASKDPLLCKCMNFHAQMQIFLAHCQILNSVKKNLLFQSSAWRGATSYSMLLSYESI